jgi:hypothetical protein
VRIAERRRAQTGALLAALFAATGLAFLLWPGGVLQRLDDWSRSVGLAGGAPVGGGFWTVLAVAYMYVVTVLAWGIRRHPAEPLYPRLLAHAKLASAALSLALFALVTPHLAFLANGLVDGALGALALALWRSCGAAPPPAPGGP